MAKILDRTGEVGINNCGSKMWISKYYTKRNVTVEFENGYVAENIHYVNFKRGAVSSPKDRSIINIGYLDTLDVNIYKTKAYTTWTSMIQRCYSDKFKEKCPTYTDCTVCEEWLSFNNFRKWFELNYYEISDENMNLDKDILVKGNKIYSPETCIFVSQYINKLFIKSKSTRGTNVIGVYYNKKLKKFQASCNNENNIKIYLGLFNTEIEAFQTYKNYKENVVTKIANRYKHEIPEKLYNILINYKVEITD